MHPDKEMMALAKEAADIVTKTIYPIKRVYAAN
jgi:hypothetical protein